MSSRDYVNMLNLIFFICIRHLELPFKTIQKLGINVVVFLGKKIYFYSHDSSILLFIYITFTFTFNHLADAFIQSDVQMRRTIEAIRPSREQQYTSAMTSLS